MSVIHTDRLSLRQWCEQDKKPFAKMCADSRVMRYFPATLSECEANAIVDKISAIIDEHGFGFWAAEVTDSQEFIGFIGLNPLVDGYTFAPCTEIGWRLKHSAWGKGYATEGAKAALRFGFESLDLTEIIAMTAVVNSPSENVMKKLNMLRQLETFKHPNVASDSVLSEHVLYRLQRTEFIRFDDV